MVSAVGVWGSELEKMFPSREASQILQFCMCLYLQKGTKTQFPSKFSSKYPLSGEGATVIFPAMVRV